MFFQIASTVYQDSVVKIVNHDKIINVVKIVKVVNIVKNVFDLTEKSISRLEILGWSRRQPSDRARRFLLYGGPSEKTLKS